MSKLYKAGKLNEKQQDCFVKPRRAEELYDVINDPYQFNNLAEDQEYKEALTEMSRLLDTWIKETDDKIPANPTPDKFDRAGAV